MKLSKLLSGTAILVIIAGGASAIEFTGAKIDLDYVNPNDEWDYSTTIVTGRAAVSVYNSVGFQLDLNAHSYSDYPEGSYFEYGLHVTYDLSPETKLGVFYVNEDWDGDNYSYIGAEVRHKFNAISVEAFVLQANDLEYAVWDPIIYGAELEYAVTDQISLFAGGTTYNDGDQFSYFYGGAAYAISDAFSAEIRVGQVNFPDNDSTTFGLGLSYSFGGASNELFNARGYTTMFSGF